MTFAFKPSFPKMYFHRYKLWDKIIRPQRLIERLTPNSQTLNIVSNEYKQETMTDISRKL
jgi:hypothetical protein